MTVQEVESIFKTPPPAAYSAVWILFHTKYSTDMFPGRTAEISPSCPGRTVISPDSVMSVTRANFSAVRIDQDAEVIWRSIVSKAIVYSDRQ